MSQFLTFFSSAFGFGSSFLGWGGVVAAGVGVGVGFAAGVAAGAGDFFKKDGTNSDAFGFIVFHKIIS